MVVLINGGGRLWSKMMYNVKDIYISGLDDVIEFVW
jgi:hypothetical protein